MAAGWITALKPIPWDDVVANAPAVLRVRTRILMITCGVLAVALVAVLLIQ